MSFDQNMIIDATTGSIARFVNHSCNPNCQMIKWIVAGQPRVALFAGDKPIQTGDELTYDYNFDPFSAKNVQKCLCGEPNCRGVLGPRPRDKTAKPIVGRAPAEVKDKVKGTVRARKRKLQEFLGRDDDEEEENEGSDDDGDEHEDDEDDDDDEDDEDDEDDDDDDDDDDDGNGNVERSAYVSKRLKVETATTSDKKSKSNVISKLSASAAKMATRKVKATVKTAVKTAVKTTVKKMAANTRAALKTPHKSRKKITTTSTKPTWVGKRHQSLSASTASSLPQSSHKAGAPAKRLTARKRAMTERARQSIEQGLSRSASFTSTITPSDEGDAY